jgi:hypothetical protein
MDMPPPKKCRCANFRIVLLKPFSTRLRSAVYMDEMQRGRLP